MLAGFAGLASLGVAACGGDGDAGDAGGSGRPVAPPAAAVAANEELLAGLPAFPGARHLTTSQMESPLGGTGAMTYAYFATPAGVERPAVISHFTTAAEAGGWRVVDEKSVVTRQTVTFERGDAWLSVTASDVSGDGSMPVPGYVLVVDAADAAVLAP